MTGIPSARALVLIAALHPTPKQDMAQCQVESIRIYPDSMKVNDRLMFILPCMEAKGYKYNKRLPSCLKDENISIQPMMVECYEPPPRGVNPN
jgi:hypothetical protein